MTPGQILTAILLAMAVAAAGTWQVQDWRYGERLAESGKAQAFADIAGDRLHIDAGKFAANACGDSGVAYRGASATRAAMVLSDLLKRTDKRAGELAAAYDRSRIAGLACERSYNQITSQQ